MAGLLFSLLDSGQTLHQPLQAAHGLYHLHEEAPSSHKLVGPNLHRSRSFLRFCHPQHLTLAFYQEQYGRKP
jgi:hypothetical protein